MAAEEEILHYIDSIIDQYMGRPGGIIPLLQKIQHQYGYLPIDGLKRISKYLHIPYSEVAGIVGFYSFFSTRPKGKNLVRVCLGTACYVRGGNEVLAGVRNELKIDIGETTEDREFSLETGRCFGACGLSPVMMINDRVVQRVRSAKIPEIFKAYKKHE